MGYHGTRESYMLWLEMLENCCQSTQLFFVDRYFGWTCVFTQLFALLQKQDVITTKLFLFIQKKLFLRHFLTYHCQSAFVNRDAASC